jgi:hypothetical protein
MSLFNNCIFETTNLPVEHGFLVGENGVQYANVAHVTLNEVRGVSFTGCQFRTVNSSAYHPHARGTGIFSIDGTAKFSTSSPNTFSNLSDAIWLTSSGFPAGVTTIDNQQFTGNIHSILLEGLPQARIVNNEIDVPESEADPLLYTIPLFKGYNKPVGIYLLGCYGYDIWDNAINVNDNSTLHNAQVNCDDCSYDIVINNTVQTDPNNLSEFGTGTVYRNTMRHASMGIQFEANNGDPITTGTGVDMKCNSMDDFYFNDLTVMGRSATVFPAYPAVYSYLRDQGGCISPSTQAGNSFSGNCNTSLNKYNIYNGINSINFIYSDIFLSSPSSNCINNNIVYCQNSITPNLCSDVLTPINDPILFYVSYGRDLENNTSTLRQILSSETDGGNTSALFNLIQTGTATAIRTELNRVSPWLSDTVMISLLNYRDILSDTGLITVYINNSGLSPAVLQAVLTASPAFNSSLIQQLILAQNKLSERRETEAQLNNSLNRLQQNIHRLVYSAVETTNYSPAIAYLDSINTTISVRELLRLHLYAGQFTLANSALNRLISLQNSSAGWFEEIAGLAIQQRDSGDSWMQLNSPQVAMLNNFYITPYEKVVPVRTLFRHRIGMQYGIEPYGQPSSGLRTAHTSNVISSKTEYGKLLLQPNPANDQLTIYLPQSENNSHVEIISATGEKVAVYTTSALAQLTVNTNEFPQGLYMVVYYTASGKRNSERLIIAR